MDGRDRPIVFVVPGCTPAEHPVAIRNEEAAKLPDRDHAGDFAIRQAGDHTQDSID